ncbi:type II toxin-antitoxin system VapB family antitoxin [Telluribacter sp.]|jgi:hypothetical protein|uniref:type II toxin-antitoxin system VapB family antitoxin n=1 Tax=Telluribacter sp. TaxID=1978767 RepID=UPI002E0FBC35|nr:DUF2281 domain-containing protein [Telluribacter sp.]
MINTDLLNKVSILPDNLKNQVADYVDFLLTKYVAEKSTPKKLRFGMMKGTFTLSEDFDKPLDDFSK